MRKLILFAFGALALASSGAEATSTPKCLIDSVFEAEALIVGRLKNYVAPNNALPNGQVELAIDELLVSHLSIVNKKIIVLDGNLEFDSTSIFTHQVRDGKHIVQPIASIDREGQILKYLR